MTGYSNIYRWRDTNVIVVIRWHRVMLLHEMVLTHYYGLSLPHCEDHCRLETPRSTAEIQRTIHAGDHFVCALWQRILFAKHLRHMV
jgi:hypothetical protein